MASNWDRWYKKKGYKVEPEIPRINRLMKNKDPKILDIGCGHGRHVIYFAAKGYQVYGIDSYGPVLKRLKQHLSRMGLAASLKTHDFTNGLPYPKGQFDLVIATRSIHHATSSNVGKILREINRVIKDQGLLFLQIPDYEASQVLENIWMEYGRPITHKWIEPHTYVPLSGPEKGILHHSVDKKELTRILKGYKIINMHVNRDRHYQGYCIVARRKSS